MRLLLNGLNNDCMFLLVISHIFMHLVTHASIHKTHDDEGQKFLEPTPPRKVFYYYAQRAFTCKIADHE